MDYYITKYQGKMMQSMTPLFTAMTQGIRKLEEQEEQADHEPWPCNVTINGLWSEVSTCTVSADRQVKPRT